VAVTPIHQLVTPPTAIVNILNTDWSVGLYNVTFRTAIEEVGVFAQSHHCRSVPNVTNSVPSVPCYFALRNGTKFSDLWLCLLAHLKNHGTYPKLHVICYAYCMWPVARPPAAVCLVSPPPNCAEPTYVLLAFFLRIRALCFPLQ